MLFLTDTKQYNNLIKFKQKKNIDDLFSQLDSMHKSDPKKYMDVINSLKNGSFDRKKSSDTSSVKSDEWFSHFSGLLGKSLNTTDVDFEMEQLF